MDTGDLWGWLIDYQGTHGINDIDIRPDLQMIDEIIDLTTKY